MGQLETDLGPELQNQLHDKVLPALVSVMDDVANPRVQSHAAAAVINFTENCKKEAATARESAGQREQLVMTQEEK